MNPAHSHYMLHGFRGVCEVKFELSLYRAAQIDDQS